MGNIEDDESARGTFDMNEKLKGMKNKAKLRNPLLHVLNVGCSFEVDEDMTQYLATPSARGSDRPKHFDIEHGGKTHTEPDTIEADKYSATPQKLLFNDVLSQKGSKTKSNLISTNKVLFTNE